MNSYTAISTKHCREPKHSSRVIDKGVEENSVSPQFQSMDIAIRARDVARILGGIGRSTLFAMLNPKSPSYDPDFPKPFKLGRAAQSPNVWWHWEVIRYLQRRSGHHADT